MNRNPAAPPVDSLRTLTHRLRRLLDDAHQRFPDHVAPARAARAPVALPTERAPRAGADAWRPIDLIAPPTAPTFTDEEGDENELPAEFATSTMGQVLLAQGRHDEARAVFRAVLARNQHDAEARAGLLALGEDATETLPAPALSLTPASPVRSDVVMLDRAPAPVTYGELVVRALPVDPGAVAVFWEVPPAVSAAPVALCVVSLRIAPSGELERIERVAVGLPAAGERLVAGLTPGAEHHLAVGTVRDGVFAPFAHAPAVRTPRGEVSPLVAHTQAAAPDEPDEPVAPVERRAPSSTELFDAARRLWMQHGARPDASSTAR